MSVPPQPPQLPRYSWMDISPSAHLLYICSELDADTELALLSTDVLGFDLEWKPVFRKGQPDNPVALVQLANTQRILLIQICKIPDFPASLKRLLEDPTILKVGAGIQNDAQKLFRDCNVSMRGCVDLALMARTVDNPQWKGPFKQPIGLARLVQTYKSLTMDKGKVQRSNWERELTLAQQTYAGNDAHAGFTIYTALEGMMKEMTIMPRTEYYTFDCVGGWLRTPSGAAWFPYNPEYDPGPPPPPPPPRIKEEQKDKQSGDVGSQSLQVTKGRRKGRYSRDARPPSLSQITKGKQREMQSSPGLPVPPRIVEEQRLPRPSIKEEQQPRIADPQAGQLHRIRPTVVPTASTSTGGTIHRNDHQTARPAFRRRPWRPRRPPYEQGQNQGPPQFNTWSQRQNMTTDGGS